MYVDHSGLIIFYFFLSDVHCMSRSLFPFAFLSFLSCSLSAPSLSLSPSPSLSLSPSPSLSLSLFLPVQVTAILQSLGQGHRNYPLVGPAHTTMKIHEAPLVESITTRKRTKERTAIKMMVVMNIELPRKGKHS